MSGESAAYAGQRPATEHQRGTQVPPGPRRWQLLSLLSVAQFMLILDVTVVAIALPTIGTDLGMSRATLTWVVSAYTLMFGGLMLLGGRAADLFGARRVVLTGLLLFTAASLVSGLATGAGSLIGGRVAQGIGAALLSPAALSVITTMFHGAERNKALGVWAALGGSGSAAGVLLGGLLTAGPGWQWIFYVNVPVGVLVFAALARMLPSSRPARRERLDVPGAVLVTAGTATAIYALVNAGDRGWTSFATLGTLGAAVVLYAVFALLQRVVRSPRPGWPSPPPVSRCPRCGPARCHWSRGSRPPRPVSVPRSSPRPPRRCPTWRTRRPG